jgi:hypothetical protein
MLQRHQTAGHSLLFDIVRFAAKDPAGRKEATRERRGGASDFVN